MKPTTQRILLVAVTIAVTISWMQLIRTRLSRTTYDTTSFNQGPFNLVLSCLRTATDGEWADMRLCVSNTDDRLTVTLPGLYQGMFVPYQPTLRWNLSLNVDYEDGRGPVFVRKRMDRVAPYSIYGSYVSLPPHAWQACNFRIQKGDILESGQVCLSNVIAEVGLDSPRLRYGGVNWSDHVWTGYRNVAVRLIASQTATASKDRFVGLDNSK